MWNFAIASVGPVALCSELIPITENTMILSLTRVRVGAALLLAIAATTVAQESAPMPKPTKTVEPSIQVRLTDDSTIKLTLVDSTIDLVTPHGKLSIPTAEIRKIELALRIPEADAKEIATAITDLGSNQFRKREEAMNTLLKHRERSYSSLKTAAQSSDAEVAKRAEELVEKLQQLVSEERLNTPDYDVIHTALSKIAGKIPTETLKVKSFSFGELNLKLSDVVAFSTSGFGDEKEKEIAGALPDPGSLTNYQNQVGKTLTFKVTGGINGSVWGSDMYTLDSSLAKAAVHMGIVKPGQTGFVKVTILGPSMGFIGSTRNGITTSPYDSYPGAYRIHPKPR